VREQPDEHPVGQGGEQDDRESFERFFVRVLPRAEAVAARLLGNPEAAEDAAVEALARAYLRWSEVSRLAYRDAWTLRVTANIARDQLRKHRPSQHQRPSPTTADHGDNTALRVSLLPAIRRLPRRQREVVFLMHVVGLTQAETSDVLDCSLGTVKSHSHRGLSRLRSELGNGFLIDSKEDT
jgi:RNA polymerase sigma factor (sigma-70 family)